MGLERWECLDWFVLQCQTMSLSGGTERELDFRRWFLLGGK